MIEILDEEILLSTKKTSMVLSYRNQKKLGTYYYGRKIISKEEIPSLIRKYSYIEGTEINLEENKPYTEDLLKLDLSVMNHSDFNSPSLILGNEKSSVFDFVFKEAKIISPSIIEGLPTPHDAKEELLVTLEDSLMKVKADLHYVLYPEVDVIGRYLVIHNENELPLSIRKAMSYQLPLVNHDDRIFSTYGHWADEFNADTHPVIHGRTLIESLTGSSSARHNPFFMILEKDCNNISGNVYGFNLVYSGNHEYSIEMDTFDNIRISQGIQSTGFEKVIETNESFSTPMGIMSFSYEGTNGLALNMQQFVNAHIIKPQWKNTDRPIIYNNWEATGPNFSKGKLVSLMKKAKSIGIELFVLDDGWFSSRNDDSHGLGDWNVNGKKLPGGLKSLSDECQKLGMKFGIWVEPEMVNDDTKLYKEHPDWIIKDNIHIPLKGRHQYVLDLSKKEVQDYIIKAMHSILDNADISYVKWDYNRNISDIPNGFSSFYHDYILGLYKVISKLTDDYPDVLFENCASGGNRFDLGMLSYFPQSWMSDDTDSYQRETIQRNALYGYPLSVMSNHVAAKTSNQLLRKTSLDIKFDVAQYGILGYELDLNDLFKNDLETIEDQIRFYKENRKVLQWGRYSLVSEPSEKEDLVLEASLDDKAIITQFHSLQRPNPKEGHLKALYLEEDSLYTYKTRPQLIPLKKFGNLVNYIAPIHVKEDYILSVALAKHVKMKSEVDEGIASGSALLSSGPVLTQEWSGVGYDEHIRLVSDFGTRCYLIRKKI